MEHVLVVTLLAILFDATHIGLASGRVRPVLVARLGERGFTAVYFVIASATFAGLIAYYAAHRFDGPAGLALGATALRWPLIGVVVVGMMLCTAGLVAYPALPSALFGQAIRTPRGIERITRHPFFVGTAMVFGAHTLLATRLVGAAFCAGVAVLAVVGAWHQDAKLRVRRGEAYGEYLATTSAVPFGAVIAGRQHIVWRELPVVALASGLGVAFVIRLVHESLFGRGGVWIIAAVFGGAITAALQSWLHARRSPTAGGVGSAPARHATPRA